MAKVIESLDLYLIGCEEILALNSHHVQANIAQVLEGFLLEISLWVQACTSVVDPVVDARCILLLQGQWIP